MLGMRTMAGRKRRGGEGEERVVVYRSNNFWKNTVPVVKQGYTRRKAGTNSRSFIREYLSVRETRGGRRGR